MVKRFTYRGVNLLLHALAWSIVLFFPYVIGSASTQYKVGPLPGFYFTLSGLVHLVIFYLNALFLYSKFLNRAYWLLYVACVVLLILLSYWIKLAILETVFPDAEKDTRLHVLFPSVIAFIASIFYSITRDKIRTEKVEKERKTLQLEMELKFLRSQISPHFLFNVITNLVYLARKKSDNLEASLIMLSGLMRYMLYDTRKKIALPQEVEYLESYVALQNLRFGRDVKITFSTDVPPKETNHTIEPMLLIPFVENAFKHGAGYVDMPSIDIYLVVTDSVLVFDVRNKFDQEKDTSKDETSGIGLSNVRSRLTLLYPGKHDLNIATDNNLFKINLTLNLL